MHITWEEYVSDVQLLGDQLAAAQVGDRQLVGITRGGVIPATMLAYRFGSRPQFIDAQSYQLINGVETRTEVIIQDHNLEFIGEDVILVDDLLDSGNTLRALTRLLQQTSRRVITATVYNKHLTIRPDYFAKTLPSAWIHFPYE
jgi:hypoxanthine phosphoribosyltransferase